MEKNKWKNDNFLKALKYSTEGILTAIKSERNFRIQLVFAFCTVLLGFLLDLSAVEFVLLVLTIGLVLFAEMVNTAIEYLFDLYSEEYKEEIKYGKDIASGAVLVTSMISVIVGIILFVPKILILIRI